MPGKAHEENMDILTAVFGHIKELQAELHGKYGGNS
jgi:hypothetical protein